MKHEGFTCDCGCGEQVVLAGGEHLMERGWWTIYPGRGDGAVLHCASIECVKRTIDRTVAGAPPAIAS